MRKNNTYKICSWNVEGRLSDVFNSNRCNSNRIFDEIKIIDADILVLLEAHIESDAKKLDSYKKLSELGYKIYSVRYTNDSIPQTHNYIDNLSMMFLCKLPINNFKIKMTGNIRNCFIATIGLADKTKLRIIGIHLDCMLESNRLNQIVDLTKIINKSKIATIMLGDYNAMHGEDIWPARFLKTKLIRLASKILFPKISKNAVEMANGSTIKYLEAHTDLVDADPKHQPTTTPKVRGLEYLPSIKLIQIDHMFISKQITINDFEIADDGGSDHRAIIAKILL